jgi:hypothetical protein
MAIGKKSQHKPRPYVVSIQYFPDSKRTHNAVSILKHTPRFPQGNDYAQDLPKKPRCTRTPSVLMPDFSPPASPFPLNAPGKS